MKLNRNRTIKILLSAIFCLVLFPVVKANWVKQDLKTFVWFQSVYFFNEKKGWIVGSQGMMLTTSDGGITWNQTPRFTSDTILDVYFTDEKTGWLLCERDIYNLGSNSPSYLLKTTDGGFRWERLEFVGGSGKERLSKLFFNKEGFGAAVGETGSLFNMQEDKKSWKKSKLPILSRITDGNFSDKFRGCLVGGNGTILFTEDAGMTWLSATFIGEAKSRLNAVFFINSKQGWTVGTEGKIFTTNNGGKVWREQKSNTQNELRDVFFLNTSEGWAIGKDGTILQTATGGNLWKPVNSQTKHQLEKIFFNGQKGWIVGFGGTLLSLDKK